jgi:CheY-like chemotaxis protein
VQPWPKNRISHRYKLDPPLDVMVHASRPTPGSCRNIGAGGGFAVVCADLSVGEEIGLEIKLSSAQKPLRLRAVVRHANGTRYGFEFVSLTARERESINRFGAQFATSAYLYSPDHEIVSIVQPALQDLGVSMVWLGSPNCLPVPNPHLVIIDSDWPDYIEVTRFLRAESEDSRVIVVALLSPNVTRKDAQALAANFVLQKPLTRAWLRKVLRTAVKLLRPTGIED